MGFWLGLGFRFRFRVRVRFRLRVRVTWFALWRLCRPRGGGAVAIETDLQSINKLQRMLSIGSLLQILVTSYVFLYWLPSLIGVLLR